MSALRCACERYRAAGWTVRCNACHRTDEATSWMYAVVELMGHRTRAGVVSDAQMGGATLLRIEHPTRADHTGSDPLAEFYAPSAIFSIRPCSAEEAAAVAGWAWPDKVARPALGPAFDELVDIDDDEDECQDLEHCSGGRHDHECPAYNPDEPF